MVENKIEKYYKLKKDIEVLDKFLSDFFISQERKDKSSTASFEFRFSALITNKEHIIFEDINVFCALLTESFIELKQDLLVKTLDKMKKKQKELREEIKNECEKFLKDECGSN
jgi:hypothetical protein